MRKHYGAERTEEILGVNIHHVLLYPGLSVQPPLQQLRAVRPLSLDRTLTEIWHFRLKGAPEAIYRRALGYYNLVNSPATMVNADDLENFWKCHQGLASEGGDWVSFHRHAGQDDMRWQRHQVALRHQRGADAQPVPRLGRSDDAEAETWRARRRKRPPRRRLAPVRRKAARGRARRAKAATAPMRCARSSSSFTARPSYWTASAGTISSSCSRAGGVYWMPASPEQTTGEGVPSIFYEDRDLMRVRMKRVTHPHAWSQAPDWGTNHIVSNVMIESEDKRAGDGGGALALPHDGVPPRRDAAFRRLLCPSPASRPAPAGASRCSASTW